METKTYSFFFVFKLYHPHLCCWINSKKNSKWEVKSWRHFVLFELKLITWTFVIVQKICYFFLHFSIVLFKSEEKHIIGFRLKSTLSFISSFFYCYHNLFTFFSFLLRHRKHYTFKFATDIVISDRKKTTYSVESLNSFWCKSISEIPLWWIIMLFKGRHSIRKRSNESNILNDFLL